MKNIIIKYLIAVLFIFSLISCDINKNEFITTTTTSINSTTTSTTIVTTTTTVPLISSSKKLNLTVYTYKKMTSIPTGELPTGEKIVITEDILSKFGINNMLGKGNIFVLRGGFDNWTAQILGWDRMSNIDMKLVETKEGIIIDCDTVRKRASDVKCPIPTWDIINKIVVFDKNGYMVDEFDGDAPFSSMKVGDKVFITNAMSEIRGKSIVTKTNDNGETLINFTESGEYFLDITVNGYIHKELNIKVTDSDITTDMETSLIEQDSTMVGNFREHSVSCSASLGGKREIIVYLPSDYYTNTTKKYPVIYMHDAQVIFRGLAIDNEWKVDNAIETYIKEGKTQGVIVVGLKNTGNRNAEYCPWQFYDGSESIGGLGDEYLDFIVNNLKPFIDTNYRTKSDRENTGIAGSSLGGLISFYGGIKHQDTFGIIGAFSSSFECKNREIIKYLEQTTNKYNSRIYIDAGNNEGYMVSDANLVYDKLISLGYKSDNLKKVIDPTGSHTISSWQKRFPDAFLWMFDGK